MPVEGGWVGVWVLQTRGMRAPVSRRSRTVDFERLPDMLRGEEEVKRETRVSYEGELRG